MKVTDISITLFKRDGSAWKNGKRTLSGERRLGIVTVQTDAGIERHAFLGSALESADVFGGPLTSSPNVYLRIALQGRISTNPQTQLVSVYQPTHHQGESLNA